MSTFNDALEWVKANSGSDNPNAPSRTPSWGNCSLHSMLGIKPFTRIPDFVLEHETALIRVIHKARFDYMKQFGFE